MEHSELVFHSRQAALEACIAAFARPDAPKCVDLQVELTPVLPEDPDNPGSFPCEESDPHWAGDYCVFGTDADSNSWAVSNEDPEWVCIS